MVHQAVVGPENAPGCAGKSFELFWDFRQRVGNRDVDRYSDPEQALAELSRAPFSDRDGPVCFPGCDG